jgi:hypothetical protein
MVKIVALTCLAIGTVVSGCVSTARDASVGVHNVNNPQNALVLSEL